VEWRFRRSSRPKRLRSTRPGKPTARQSPLIELQALPRYWPEAARTLVTDVLSPAQRKALLRCLIDKVVIHRARAVIRCTPRIVWRGGETTTFEVPVAVGALTDLPTAHERAQQIGCCLPRGIATTRWPSS